MYLTMHAHMNIGMRHEVVLSYLPDHMQCEILLAQHRSEYTKS